MTIKPRERTCKADGCTNKFMPYNSIQSWCSPSCGLSIANKKLAHKERKKVAAQKKIEKIERQLFQKRKRDIKPVSWFHKKARDACNPYIRFRDRFDNCISCNKPLAFEEKYDAGHWKTQGGHKWIAYDEVNINGQCVSCNQHQSGNEAAQRPNLVAKWGIDEVERLEQSGKNLGDKSYTREELLDIEKHYKKKLKELQDNE